MTALQDKITGAKWQALSAPCRAAFPAAEQQSPELPKNPLDAELGCEELAQFLTNALGGQKDYGNEVVAYRTLHRTLGDRLGPALRARVGGGFERQQAAGREALARTVSLGSPVPVMQLCLKRFG